MNALRSWIPVVLWMVFIFAMSTRLGSTENSSRIVEPVVRWVKPDATPEQFEFTHFIVRKLGHLSEYAVLALLAFRALKRSLRPPLDKYSWPTAILALLVTAAYATTDEWHQSFVPGRTPTFHDVMIDATGGLMALLAVLVWCSFLSPRFRTSASV